MRIQKQLPPILRRVTPLAAALATFFAIVPAAAVATVFVTNCEDAGAGSLRAAVSPIAAANGDTIDMTTLTCSNISLRTGAIVIQQNDLTLLGPGVDRLTIDGKYQSRVINHQGYGTLTLKNMAIVNGYEYSANFMARGGCVYSSGSVILDHTRVAQCKATSIALSARGGGVFTDGKLRMVDSAVRSSKAASSSGSARGGGIMASTYFAMSYSTLENNSAIAGSDVNADGGGAYVHGNTFIDYSTISGNTSSGNDGGIRVTPAVAAYGDHYSFQISNSTISGNHADHFVGGTYSDVLTRVTYSTFAFNTAGAGSFNAGGTTIYLAPGFTVFQHNARLIVQLYGVLAANNTYGSSAKENDVDVSGATVSANYNFIRVSNSSLPGVNIAGACPLLGPLRDNGGSTQTHALLSHSPAIDRGLASGISEFDQRGPFFVRHSGLAGYIDIGAYEVQQNDIVFNAGFEDCPAL